MTKTKAGKQIKRLSPSECVKIARKVTWIGFWVNAALGVIKVIGGVFGRSSALIADGIHSFSDFLSDIIVILMVGIARKKPDQSYQFGHGRFEALATLLLSLVLAIVAFGICYEGIKRIIDFINGEMIPKPGMVTLVILLLAIISKEWLFHYTKKEGERIQSEAVIANAWHHRSDSLSSITTLIGVCGAIFLGERWRILDPIAAIVVGIFIIIISYKLAMPAIKEMLGISLSKKAKREILKAIKNTPGVLAYHNLQTFKSGNDGYVMVHIKVDPDITVREAHNIATQAERNMKKAVSELQIHASTHIEPFKQPKNNN